MATNGQELERLVEVLEKMDMLGAEIKTRDRIFDKVANELREVDVSVRFRKGSHDFLIIFECRDRKRKNGPDWIEHIIQKTRDLGANKVIAVSASGFTKGAIEKAKHYDIKLRTFEEISSQEIFDWFLPKSFTSYRRDFDIKRMILFPKLSDPETNEKLDIFIKNNGGKLDKKKKFILQNGVQNPKSPNEVLLNVDPDILFSGVICGGPKVQKTIEIYPEDESAGFQILIDNDQITIDHFIFITVLSIVEKKSDIRSVKEYKVDKETLAQVVKFGDVDFPDGKKSIEFVLKPGEEGNRLSIRFIEPENS